MKKIIISVIASLATAVAMTASASAATITCSGSITGPTGPNSNNSVSCIDEQENSVTCENNVIVSNTNEQNAHTGDAFTTNNSSVGDSSTGNANNENSVVVKVGASCAPVTTASTTPTPTTQTGGKGAAEKEQVKAPAGPVNAGSGVQANLTAPILGLAISAALVSAGVGLRLHSLKARR